MERFLAFCQRAFLVLLLVYVPMHAIGSYTMTQGTGLTFGDVTISAVHYAAHIICDATVGSTQCAAVTSGNALKVDASATTQPVSSTTLATAANQTTGNASLATIATNTGAAIPTQATSVPIGGVSNDPCQYATKLPFAISTTSGTQQIVAPSGSTQVYICSLAIITDTPAVKVNLVGGTGAACTTGTPVAAMGSTTAANGMSLAANGGLTFGNGGATVTRTTTAGHGMCVIQSGTSLLGGGGTYVQQ